MKKLILSLALLALSLNFNLFAQTISSGERLRSREKTDWVMVAAHRGDWQFAPENSLLSLKHDIFWGVDIMETDIHLTKDEHLVMMHDTSVDRTTNGSGNIADMTLEEIKKLRLLTCYNSVTEELVPTLEEFLTLAKGKVCLYLDKAGMENRKDDKRGYKIKKILEVLHKENALTDVCFVLSFSYSEAKEIFGKDLEYVNYIPAIEDGMENLEAYVDEYINKLHPVAFQFRMRSTEGDAYKLLPKVLASGSKAFVAATWAQHTAGHDDMVSIFSRPSEGWGWLIDQGFRIVETNYPKDMIEWLKRENRH